MLLVESIKALHVLVESGLDGGPAHGLVAGAQSLDALDHGVPAGDVELLEVLLNLLDHRAPLCPHQLVGGHGILGVPLGEGALFIQAQIPVVALGAHDVAGGDLVLDEIAVHDLAVSKAEVLDDLAVAAGLAEPQNALAVHGELGADQDAGPELAHMISPPSAQVGRAHRRRS